MPFVLQLLAAVGLVGYLSFKNGEKAVFELANRVIEQTHQGVDQHLDAYLSIPHRVNQINADAIQLGLLHPHDMPHMTRYFWYQMQAYDLNYISFMRPTGEVGAAFRPDGQTVTLDYIQPFTSAAQNNATTYLTDRQGNPTKILAETAWDALSESSYTEPVKAKKPIWSQINTYYDPALPPYIAAAAGRPIYDEQQKLIGVLNTEIHLENLSDFLRQLARKKGTDVFIVERNGLLVANSTAASPFKLVQQEIQRVPATASPSLVVREIAQQMQQQFSALATIRQSQKLVVQIQGEPYYVRITPWQDEYGLDWLVVTSIAENSFMDQINANNQTMIVLCIGAGLVATIVGVITSRWISYPIWRLNQASQAMAVGQLEQTIKPTHVKELNILADSFNRMAGQLKAVFVTLENNNTELEQHVEERTIKLKAALDELQHTQLQMIQAEKMSSLGQLVAGIAHEVNNPLNFVQGNLAFIQDYSTKLIDLLALYEQHDSAIAPVIQAKVSEIDLEFIQADLPKLIHSMQIGTDRIQGIVQSLRTFSRMDESELQTVNIHDGLDSTLLILQHRLKAQPDRGEIMVVQDYGDLPSIDCYAGQLNQVFMNLLANAIDALEARLSQQTPAEQAANRPEITIRTERLLGNGIAIKIGDNGCGMPETIQRRIFDPFFTTKPVGKGTGIGMSISYQIIVERHHGTLDCVSQPGCGTEFVIRLPQTPIANLLDEEFFEAGLGELDRDEFGPH